MAIKIRQNKKELQIYRDTNSVTLFTILLSVTAIIFGIGFIYIGYSEKYSIAFLIGGSIFSFLGLFLLLTTKKEHKKMKENNGFIHLSATEKGVSLAPKMGMMEERLYSWEQVSRIVLTKLFISDSDDGIKSKNIAIVYLQGFDNIGLIERSKADIWKTPENNNVIMISLPAEQLAIIQQSLISISQKKVKVEFYSRVEFIYSKSNRREVFQT